MSKRGKEVPHRQIWGSVEGIVQSGSLSRDKSGLSALVRSETGAELRIKGYGDRFSDMISAAAERGESVIFRGHMLGSIDQDNVHLSVLLEGPAELNGPVSRIRRSGEGKEPYVGFWLMNEVTSREGRTYRIGTAVNVYGEAASALSGLREGDRVCLLGRDGENGYIATSPVTILPDEGPEGPRM